MTAAEKATSTTGCYSVLKRLKEKSLSGEDRFKVGVSMAAKLRTVSGKRYASWSERPSLVQIYDGLLKQHTQKQLRVLCLDVIDETIRHGETMDVGDVAAQLKQLKQWKKELTE